MTVWQNTTITKRNDMIKQRSADGDAAKVAEGVGDKRVDPAPEVTRRRGGASRCEGGGEAGA